MAYPALCLTALMVLSASQDVVDERVPDRVGLPDFGHRGTGLLHWHALPQHPVEEHKGGDAHIGDTVDKPFLVLCGLHGLEEALQICLSRVLPDNGNMDVLHPLSR